MNFPQVHGARIVPQPDPELVAAEARLAALDHEQLVAVRSEWIDDTVAMVAGKPQTVRGGRLRRAAAAAVAFLALHGFATAATVTAVSAVAVTAVVLWPERANSNETMSYELAIEILLREDQAEEDRASGMVQIVRRVKGCVDALRFVGGAVGADEGVRAAAAGGLREIRDCMGGAMSSSAALTCVDPLPTVLSVFDPVSPRVLDLDGVSICIRGARAGIGAMKAMPESNARLSKDREVALRRLGKMVGL